MKRGRNSKCKAETRRCHPETASNRVNCYKPSHDSFVSWLFRRGLESGYKAIHKCIVKAVAVFSPVTKTVVLVLTPIMLPWFGLHRGQDVQQGGVSGRIGSCCVCRSERISRTCVIWVSVPGNWGIQDMCDLGQCARQLCRGVLMVECMSQDPHTHTHIHTYTHTHMDTCTEHETHAQILVCTCCSVPISATPCIPINIQT